MTVYNLLMLSGDSSVARGVEGAFARTLARFSRHWARIDVLTPTAPGASARQLYDNVYVHPAPLHRVTQPLFIRRQGAALLAERDYHLVASTDYGFFYNGIGAYWLLRGRDIPWVSEVHHVEGWPLAVTARERLWRQAALRYLPWAARHVAAFRVDNNGDVPALLRAMGVPDEKILVLPPLYLDFDLFRPLPGVDKRYDVLFVGRLATNKGLPLLLEVARLAAAQRPGFTLALRGDGPLHDWARAFVTEHALQANVMFVPRVPDAAALARLYNEARLLVCASTVEGGPRVTAEAMACGTPVLTTPVGLMPEIITSGVNGVLIERDPAALAAHLLDLLADDDRRARLGEAGRQAVQRFDADTVIANYARGYHGVIERWQQALHA
jgi:glycosyltransferase involved in cell wall biosynthesis